VKHLFKVLSLIAILALILMPALTWAEEKEGECGDGACITGDFRWRMEHDGRDFNADTGPGSFSSLRTRINAMWHEGDYQGYVQVQQFNTLGTGPGSDLSLGIHRAMFGKENCLTEGGYLWLGRMTLTFGDERLIGAADWGMYGNAFDGILHGIKKDQYWAELFYTKLAENYAGDVSVRDDAFYGLWGEYTPLKLQAFVLGRKRAGQRPTDPTNWQNPDVRNTLGIYYTNEYPMNIGTTFNFAYQMGTDKTLNNPPTTADVENDIAAMMYALEVWYNLKDVTWSPTFGVGIDAYTGDDPTTPDKVESFDNLYWTGHKFFGYMDYFTANQSTGMQDIFVKAKVHPKGEDSYLKLMFHIFSTSENYASAVDGSDATALGNEIDLVCGNKMGEMMNMEAGLGYFMPAEEWVGKDKDSSLWAYLQLQLMLGKCECKE